jgi:hypothetical protein
MIGIVYLVSIFIIKKIEITNIFLIMINFLSLLLLKKLKYITIVFSIRFLRYIILKIIHLLYISSAS